MRMFGTNLFGGTRREYPIAVDQLGKLLLAGADEVANMTVFEQGRFVYETVAASQTDQILGPVGGVGNYLHALIMTVTTAATAAVSLKDGNGGSIPILPNSPGGGIGVYVVEFNLQCVNATTPGWKVTTGAGVSVLGIGRFT